LSKQQLQEARGGVKELVSESPNVVQVILYRALS